MNKLQRKRAQRIEQLRNAEREADALTEILSVLDYDLVTRELVDRRWQLFQMLRRARIKWK
jgi:hypothetical protein